MGMCSQRLSCEKPNAIPFINNNDDKKRRRKKIKIKFTIYKIKNEQLLTVRFN